MNVIPRNKYLTQVKPFKKKNIIKVLVGHRRCGKSYLLKYLVEQIKKSEPRSNIIFIDKELYEFDFIKDDNSLYKYIKSKMKRGFNYIFIDEVQEIKNFEKVLRDLYKRKNTDIYVTGSNAHLFSSELATYLSGRYIEIRVNPLSYVEFLQFHKLENTDESLMKYLRFGGMPYLMHLDLEDEIVFSYLKSIYDTLILKDVVLRHNLRNLEFLIKLTKYLAENTGNIISANKISAYLKNQRVNVPVNTIINYLNLLESTFLIDKVSRMDLRGKKVFEINEKYFFGDLGLRNSLIGFRAQDIAKIIENAVYNHLIYLGFDVKIGVSSGKEIDFVAEKKNRKMYVQVSYLISDQATLEREFGNLLAIKDNYKKIVVSMDNISFDDYEGIEHYRLIDFLSSEKV